MGKLPTISISGRLYARLAKYALEHGVSLASVVERAVGYVPAGGPLQDRAAIEVSDRLHAALVAAGRRVRRSAGAVLDRAICAAIDLGELPTPSKKRRTMVAHQNRRAA